MPKCQNSNATFWVIFKQCGNGVIDQKKHHWKLDVFKSLVNMSYDRDFLSKGKWEIWIDTFAQEEVFIVDRQCWCWQVRGGEEQLGGSITMVKKNHDHNGHLSLISAAPRRNLSVIILSRGQWTALNPRRRRWIREHFSLFQIPFINTVTRCLKITEKVSFDIATFTFWVDKSLLKMPKMLQFGEFLKT